MAHDGASAKTSNIQVISRAANILRLLGQETAGLSLGQIATRVELPRSTVQRIVSALASEGFVAVGSGHRGIKLGPEIQTLARVSDKGPRERLRPTLQRIADATGETVDLAVLQNGRMLFVDQIVGPQRLRTVSSIGDTFPLADTANGKAALACLDEVEAANLLISELNTAPQNSRPLTERLAEIEAIRQGALSTDEDEHTDGISAIGFGIRDISGEVFAVSVPVPSSRYDRQKDRLVAALTAARGQS